MAYEGIFEVVRIRDGQLFAQPEDSLGLRVLRNLGLAMYLSTTSVTHVQVVEGRSFLSGHLSFDRRCRHIDGDSIGESIGKLAADSASYNVDFISLTVDVNKGKASGTLLYLRTTYRRCSYSH